jgi:hypothetical protein
VSAALPQSPAASAHDEGALAAVRRADWRFLLPDPDLGRVAYLAPHDPELAEALGVVGAQVDLLARPRPTADHDVLVVGGGSPGRAAAAGGLLRPGGWLYAETTGLAARGLARTLRAAGFEEVAAHWLWPNRSACREIVPLAPGPLRHALGRRDPGARVRARGRAAALLAAGGGFAVVARHAAVIGRRP